MGGGINKLVKKSEKTIGKTKIDMPSDFKPVIDSEAKYYNGALKAYCILAQKDSQGSWHSVKTLIKPAVDGLLFTHAEKIYMIDTRKTWLYDNGKAIVIYDIKQMMPVNIRMEKDASGNDVTTTVVKPIEALEPTEIQDPDVIIDSGWIFTVVIKKMIEQLTRASTPEQQQFNLFTLMMIGLGVVAGISLGMILAPAVFHLVPASSGSAIGTTVTTVTQGGIPTTTVTGFGSNTVTVP